MRLTGFSIVLGLIAAPAAFADNVINDDTIIYNSLCVGQDCSDPENYDSGEAVVRLKHLYPRVEFIDTSTSTSSFPSNNWMLRANEDFAGGDELFAIENLSNNTRPFVIQGDAPSNSLAVDDDGAVGFGTGLPQRELHIISNNSPTIRFEQSAAGGFPAQTWDMLFNHGNVYIRDINNNTTPFSIFKNAPTDSLRISQEGNIGNGTSNPGSALHIVRDNGFGRIRVEENNVVTAARELIELRNNGGSYFSLVNTATGNSWYYVHENNTQGRFMINHSDGGIQMALTRTGDMTLMGELFTAGSCAAGCDRVFDEDYPLPSIAEQAAMMREMKHLPNVGPTPEDGPFNITKMTGGMLNELEKAHLFIVDLHEENTALKAQVAAQEARLSALEALVSGE
ncbi:hypothetical protein [Pacificoceanicola onchidii]|uniref:hypothetical protein n=1 Tax=Pacificoceanicola onchidii TaxID=2562685 RepID=UPI0010A2FEAC|nr:hypothetical protein [Pacificoceanicola onchidii]